MATMGQSFLPCFSGGCLSLLPSSKRLLTSQNTHLRLRHASSHLEEPTGNSTQEIGAQNLSVANHCSTLLSTMISPNNLGFWATITSLDVGKLQFLLQLSTFNDSTTGSVLYTAKCIHANMFSSKPV